MGLLKNEGGSKHLQWLEMTGLKPKGSLKNEWGGGSEILQCMKMTGLKPMGLFENERGTVKIYIGWK